MKNQNDANGCSLVAPVLTIHLNPKSLLINNKILTTARLLSGLIVMFLFLQSCKNKDNEVKVVQRSFTDEVELQQNFNITFNRELVPDSMLDQWETTPYFTFSPAVDGRFKWVSSHELMFSPDKGLSPCTSYKLELKADKILSRADKKLYLGGEVAYSFHTAMLELTNADFHWKAASDNSQLPVLSLMLNFNYELNPAEVLRRLSITNDGKALTAKLSQTTIGATIHLEISNAPVSDDDIAVKIEIAKGLPVPKSTYTTDKEISYETVIPSKNKLVITNVETDHNGEQGSIMVTTSEELNESTIKGAISFEPQVEFDVAKNNRGFSINSKQLLADNVYKLKVSTLLQGALGGKLKENYEQDILFGKLQPAIKFVSNRGMYLGALGSKNIAVTITSIPKVKLKVYKIYENNIIQFMKEGLRYRSHYEEGEEEGDYEYYEFNNYNTDEYGDLILEQEYETRKLPKQGELSVLNLDFEDRIKDQRGIYVVQLQSNTESWIQANKIIAISDIGLIVKESERGVMVIANSISTAKPLSSVKVNIISRKNQVVKTITTNSDGVAVFDKIENSFPPYEVNLITAELGGDYNYLKLNTASYGYDEGYDEGEYIDETGGKYTSSRKYDAFIYGDRDIYRPGETMYISCIIRDMQWNKPGDLPVKLKIFLPNGREFKTIKKVLNDQGSFETAVVLPAGIVTGTYRATVSTGDDVLLASKALSVEEFMPDKISVKAQLSKDTVVIGDSIQTDITATNLFGPPAGDRNYSMEMSLYGEYFSSKTFSDYNFNFQYRNTSYNIVERSGKTDEQGKIRETFAFSEATYANNGMLGGKIFTTVFDESGRPVNRERYFKLITQKVFVGIKYSDSYVSLNQPYSIDIAAISAKDQPMKNVGAYVTVIKREWQTVLQKVGNRFQYNSQQVEKVVLSREIVINSKASMAYTPALSGDYEVRLYLKGANNYVSQRFYAYGYGHTSNTSFEVSNDGAVDIETDKEGYKTGETIKLLFKTPFPGRLIVTVEQDKVVEFFSLMTDAKSASYSLKIKDNFVPNIFISAILIRESDDGSNPLIVAHGVKDIRVENPDNKLPLQITAPATSRSKTKQTISVKTAPNSTVTIAVVDEGILQLKNFQTPDPYGYFYASRALAVNSYDIYPLMFPEIMLKNNLTGGGGYDLAKRVNPLTNKRVNLVAMWSGIIKADDNGNAAFTINIPQFNGDLRIMAVSYYNQKFAGTDVHMKVADPVVINTGLPRFTSPRDTVMMPVTLTNTTRKPATATVTVNVTGPLKVVNEVSQNVTIKANSEARVNFIVAAANNIGNGKITCSVNALNEKFIDETEITIRPPSSLQKLSGNGDFNAGESKVLSTAGNFIPSTVAGKLIVSRSPLVSFADDLTYLIQYPYGCVEQTTSSAFPQIYYYDLAKTVMKKASKDPNPNYNVQQAIAKLQSMQLSNGALCYWSGGGYESWFGTVYAAHFLAEAKKAGFDIDQQVLNRMHNYMIEKMKVKQTVKYYYNSNLSKEIAPKEVAYSLYVLALANKPQVSMMNYYRSNIDMLSLDGKYLLAAAYALSGNKLNYQQLLPQKFEGEISVATTGGSFYSAIRDEALALNALLEVDPSNPQVGIMARHVSQEIKRQKYPNTQERVFTFLAMGKIARMNRNNNATATIRINGKAAASMSDKDAEVSLKGNDGNRIEITSSGSGKVYYFWTSEGLTADGSYKAEDSFIKVRKSFYNRNGSLISNLSFKQNDLVVIKISVMALTKANIENVVITDMLPAGFEIENPRIGVSPDMTWIKYQSEADHQDFRDDRVNLFTSVNSSPKDFYYVVRCVTKGKFQMGPVSADAMYNGEYHSYNGSGTIQIQ